MAASTMPIPSPAIEYAVLMKKDFGVNLVAINASFGGAGDNPLQKDAIAAAGDQGIVFGLRRRQ